MTPSPRTLLPSVGEYAPPGPPESKPPIAPWLVAVIAVTLSVGISIGSALWVLDSKADAKDLRALDDRTSRVERVMDRIDSRIGEIYCGSLPLDRRAGCR